MDVASTINKYYQWLDDKTPLINTYANHLIVIFAFSVPVLTEVRRTSLVLLILLFLIRGRMLQRIREALRDPVVLAFTLYFLVHVVWMAGTDDFEWLGEVIHDASFLLIPLLFSTFIDRRYTSRIVAAFFAGMLVSVLISFGIFLEWLPAMMHNGNQGDWKDPTPFYHHTHYGYMLALTSVILLTKFITADEQDGRKAVWVLLMVLAAANVFIIAGRAGFVLLVILVPALYLMVYKKKALPPLMIMAAVISVATAIAYHKSPTFSLRVDTTIESVEKIIHERDYYSSLGGRAAMSLIAIDMAANNWIFGVGTGDHTGQMHETIKRDYSEIVFLARGLAHPHNEYLNALLQFGIIGLLVFLNIPLQLLRYKNENRNDALMFRLIGISIIFYVLQDILVIDLGMLFTVVVLVSANLREYPVSDTKYVDFNLRQAVGYMLVMLVFYLLKQI